MAESGAPGGLAARATTDRPRLSKDGFLRLRFVFFRLRNLYRWRARGPKVAVPRRAATTDSTRVRRIGEMIPVRVSHNPSIGPGVVPAGVDPAYDAQYANHKGPTAHVGANGHGRPFSVAPGPITHTQ
jgi:hypothetical protein